MGLFAYCPLPPVLRGFNTPMFLSLLDKQSDMRACDAQRDDTYRFRQKIWTVFSSLHRQCRESAEKIVRISQLLADMCTVQEGERTLGQKDRIIYVAGVLPVNVCVCMHVCVCRRPYTLTPVHIFQYTLTHHLGSYESYSKNIDDNTH